MFDDKIEADDFNKMPEEYRDLLVRVLRIQADCEIGGPHLYIEWGIKRCTNMEARQEYIAEVSPILEKLGLKIPDPEEGRKFV